MCENHTTMSKLSKIELIKDYAIRHDIVIEKGSTIHVGPHRAAQLIKGGYVKDNSKPKQAKKEESKD